MSWSTTMERLGKFFVAEENAERRDARGIEQETARETGLEQKEAAAEAVGNVAAVLKYLATINDLERKEVAQLFDIFTNIRILTLGHLHTVVGIEMEIKRSAKLKEKEVLLREIDAYKRMIAHNVNNMFQSVTSMDSASISAEQHLLTLATQVRDLYNAANRSRGGEKKFRRVEKNVIAMLPRSDDISHLMREYGSALKRELDDIHTTVKYAVTVLKKKKDKIESHSVHIRELVARSGFPAVAAKNIETQFGETMQILERKMISEVSKERIGLSEAQRAA